MNIAKDIAQYLSENTEIENIFYSQLPPSADYPQAVAVIQYNSGLNIDYRAPDIIPAAVQIVCRDISYDAAIECASKICSFLKNIGNSALGYPDVSINGNDYIRVSARGTPEQLKEDETENIYITQNYYIWIRNKED